MLRRVDNYEPTSRLVGRDGAGRKRNSVVLMVSLGSPENLLNDV